MLVIGAVVMEDGAQREIRVPLYSAEWRRIVGLL